MNEKQQGKAGFWGSSLSKLKSALAKTKEAVVDSIVDRSGKSDGTPISAIRVPQPVDVGSLESTALTLPSKDATEASSHVQEAAVMTAASRAVAVDEEYLEELEEKLIRADLGLQTAEALVADLRKEARAKKWTSDDVESFLKMEFSKMLAVAPDCQITIAKTGLTIILVVGVNGTGKTTSIGKLCHRLKKEGRRVLMAAADTFRAAAESQLEIWAERAKVDIVRLADGSDPGAVVFQAIKKLNLNPMTFW